MAIATKGLTGAIVAYGNALRDAIGEEKYNAFIEALWSEAGKGAKEFADNLSLATDTAKDLETASELFAMTGIGPEYKFDIIEATADRCVVLGQKTNPT